MLQRIAPLPWEILQVAILAGALVFKANQESGGKELGSGVLKGPPSAKPRGAGGALVVMSTYGSYNVDITNWENPRFLM
jgi:hypothetical protein